MPMLSITPDTDPALVKILDAIQARRDEAECVIGQYRIDVAAGQPLQDLYRAMGEQIQAGQTVRDCIHLRNAVTDWAELRARPLTATSTLAAHLMDYRMRCMESFVSKMPWDGAMGCDDQAIRVNVATSQARHFEFIQAVITMAREVK